MQSTEPDQRPTAEKLQDIDAARGAVVDAAGICSGLWLSYILAVSYVTVAVGGVTHRDMLLAKPSALPFIGTEVPLVGFGWLMPALLLVAHLYVLLHFVLLSMKVNLLDRQLDDVGASMGERLRRQLPINIFVQFLAGPHEARTGLLGVLLRSMSWITLVVAPIALLLLLLIRLLPYHAAGMSRWHEVAVLLDLAMLWFLWPTIVNRTPICSFRAIKWHTTGMILACVTVAAAGGMLCSTLYRGDLVYVGTTSFLQYATLLVVSDKDGNRDYIVSSRLVLEHLASTGNDAAKRLSLAGRLLDDAVLTDASLPNANLSYADLRGAQLFRSDLEGADFTEARLEGANLDNAVLRNAILDRAKLAGATLYGAQLQGATLKGADLRGANLKDANLQNADLDGALLEGAVLDGASLQGAVLDRIPLDQTGSPDQHHGARLEGASLQQTLLWRAAINDSKQLRIVVDNTSDNHPCANSQRVCKANTDLKDLRAALDRALPAAEGKSKRIDDIIAKLDDTKGMPVAGASAEWSHLGHAEQHDAYVAKVLYQWDRLACGSGGAPHVLEGLAHTLIAGSSPLGDDKISANTLRNRFLAADCAGASGLAPEIRAKLEQFGNEAQMTGRAASKIEPPSRVRSF